MTLVEFIDMQCPFCREFEVEVLPGLIEKHIRTGKVRMEIRGLTFVGPDSERGMRAVLAAGGQNHLYELMELMYFNQGPENSGWLSQDFVEAGRAVDPRARRDAPRRRHGLGRGLDLIEEHAADAERRGVNSTHDPRRQDAAAMLTAVDLASPTDAAAVERAIADATGR